MGTGQGGRRWPRRKHDCLMICQVHFHFRVSGLVHPMGVAVDFIDRQHMVDISNSSRRSPHCYICNAIECDTDVMVVPLCGSE